MDDNLDKLSRTLYGESEVGDIADAEAIACVVLNRSKKRNLTVAQVCLQPEQFSCWNKTDKGYARVTAPTITGEWWDKCCAIAQKALNGQIADPTAGSLHYHANYVTPKWAKGHVPVYETPAGRYTHFFYNDIDQKVKVVNKKAQSGKTVAIIAGSVGVATQAAPAIQVLSSFEWKALVVLTVAALLVGAFVWWQHHKDVP